MSRYPKISVIIPMYNAAKTIENCIKSLTVSDYPDFEVIVVDDASTDNSVSITSKLPCKLLIMDKNSGPGVARNKGAGVASGEIVAFTDADCEVPRDWLNNIAKDLEDREIGAVSGAYSKPMSRNPVALFQFYDTCFRQRNTPRHINSCCTPNFACRKNVFERTGGFPPQRINEDMEFGMNLSESCKILWDKNNGVFHYFTDSIRWYFIKQIGWSESVVKSYLSAPKSIFKKSTWNNSEICIHLLFTSLLYLALIIAFWYPFSIIIFILLALFYYLINIDFLRFVAEREGMIFALKMPPLLFIENTAWLLGIFKGIFTHNVLKGLEK